MSIVERVVVILNHLAVAQATCSVTEVSRELGLSKSTVYRILSSLQDKAWVTQDPETQRYTLGGNLLELSLSLLSKLDLRSFGLSYLSELSLATNETGMLSLRVGLERMIVDQVPSYHEVRHLGEPGKRLPLWCGAPGKVILAYLEESEIENVIESLGKSGMQVLASGQPLDIDRLREELAEIRNQGFTVTVGERIAALTGVAAPIFGRNHEVMGAISVSGPLPRFSPEIAKQYGPLVKQMASKISLRLGHFEQNSRRVDKLADGSLETQRGPVHWKDR